MFSEKSYIKTKASDTILELLSDKSETVNSDRNQSKLEDRVQEVESLFSEKFWERTPKYVAIGIGSLLLLLLASEYIEVHPQAYGLLLDLEGAIILGRGLLKGKFRMAEESMSHVGYSPPRTHSLVEDATDGFWGIAFLLIGIILQIVVII